MVVYKITNTANGMLYVGHTTTPLKFRFDGHLAMARTGNKRPLYEAIRTFGSECFEVEVLSSHRDLIAAKRSEARYIRLLDTVLPRGYNISPGSTWKQLEGQKIKRDKGWKAYCEWHRQYCIDASKKRERRKRKLLALAESMPIKKLVKQLSK